jgi:sialic acid synthase SpsE
MKKLHVSELKNSQKKIPNFTKVICELGINHNGSIKICKKLIKQARESGSWGVKFQYRNLKNYLKNIKSSEELGKEIINKEVKKNYLSPKKIQLLSNYAKNIGLKIGISFFLIEDILDFKKVNFDFYKIPSPASDNFGLIKKLLSFKKMLMISFGGRSLISINKILRQIPQSFSKTIVLFHCTSNYPAHIINSNLGFIDILKKKFKNYLIGYSSHEKDILNCIYVLSKKISFIERHITHNRDAKGLDHSSSSEFKDFKILNYYCKNLDIIDQKNKNKIPNQGEIINIQNLGSSYVFKKNIKSGTVLKKHFLRLQQPKVGIDDLEIKNYLGLKIKKNAKKNSYLQEGFFKDQKLSNKHFIFTKKKKISIPVRPHDYKELNKEINGKYYELHLSYVDLKNFSKNTFEKEFIMNNHFSVHAPDYVDENTICDLFSMNKHIRIKSNQLIKKCVHICSYISSLNNLETKLIVSISRYNKNLNKKDFYLKVLNKLKKIKKISGIEILPQWLPVYAWYFGGSEKIDIFSNPLDLKILSKINLKICMDTSHFLLSCNFYNVDPDFIFFKNLKIYEHFHLSDAIGVYGEGVKFGTGDLFKTRLLKYILKQKKSIVVLETWQGHLNGGIGFKKDIIYLHGKNNRN